jgi:hypothetical protein
MVVGWISRYREKADLRVVGCFHFIGAVARKLERQAHIRLPAAQPDVADHDVLQLHILVAGDLDRVGAACGRRLNLHLPAAVCSSDGRYCPFSNLDHDRFTGLRPAPDGIRLVALQNHVVAEDGADERERLGGHLGGALSQSAAMDRKREHRYSGHMPKIF